MFWLSMAQYRYFVEQNKQLAISALLKAEERNPLLDQSFFIFRFRRMLDEQNADSGHNDGIIFSAEL